jgi:hypothetical protein
LAPRRATSSRCWCLALIIVDFPARGHGALDLGHYRPWVASRRLPASRWALTPLNLLERYGRDDEYDSPRSLCGCWSMFDVASALVVAGARRCLLLALPPGPGQPVATVWTVRMPSLAPNVGGGTIEPEGGRGLGQL